MTTGHTQSAGNIQSASGFGLATAVTKVKSLFASIQSSIATYRTFQRTVEELNALSDRELDDINIRRSDISRIAMEEAFGSK